MIDFKFVVLTLEFLCSCIFRLPPVLKLGLFC